MTAYASETVAGSTIDFGYDDDGLLTTAGALSLSRDPANGLITGTTLGSVTTAQSYDGFGELATASASFAGASLYSASYTRDKLGRITTKIETIQGVTTTTDYTYDSAGRLDRLAINGVVTRDFEYDANGNRLSIAPGGAVVATYDAQDRLLQHGASIYAYTANGELLSKTDTATGQTTQYGYDVLGNLRSILLPNGSQIEYLTDGRNRRIGRRSNGQRTDGFLYQDQLRPVAWIDANGALKARFVYDTRSNVPAYMVSSTGTNRILTDHLGSPRLIVDAGSGAVMQRLDYGPFGDVVVDTNPGFSPFGFTGGLYDADTNVVRLGARDYDPEAGRWMAKDPLLFEALGSNLYEYLSSEPVNASDPFGLADFYCGFECDASFLENGAIGGGFVFDSDEPGESGVYDVEGRGCHGGFNVGCSIGCGFASKDVEGPTLESDVNWGPLSLVLTLDDENNPGGFVGVGPGLPGVSSVGTETKTTTINEIRKAMKGPSWRRW